jgi:hypothetical protein
VGNKSRESQIFLSMKYCSCEDEVFTRSNISLCDVQTSEGAHSTTSSHLTRELSSTVRP